MIDILLLDDHRVFSEGLSQLLKREQWVNRVRTFVSPDEFLGAEKIWSALKPADLILLDVSLGQLINGIDVCKKVKERFPENYVIGLSMHNEYRYIKGMLDAGASGYFLKSDTFDEIIKGINLVREGKQFLSKSAEETLNYFKDNQIVLKDLSFREKKIIELSLKGLTNNEIAEQLNVSHKTIEYYKSGIYEKFNVKNLIELNNLLHDN